MSPLGVARGYWISLVRWWTRRKLSRTPGKFKLDRASWERSLSNPTEFYLECLRCYYRDLPDHLREHRIWYFGVPGNRRGFGEDAFHAQWYLLLEQFKPASFLEIGVFRGQVISLVSLWAKQKGVACEVTGISPFSPAGDSVSAYRKDVDYYEDTLANFAHFNLPLPQLFKAYSTDPGAVALIASRSWDMIYVDGSHDYEVVKKDWEVCSKALKVGGVIVLDDSGLGTMYRPPAFATGGHPGPSQMAQELDRTKFREILQVGHNRAFQKIA